MEVPASWRVGFLVRNAIAKSTPLSQRLTLVANAVTQTDGLFAPVDFIALLGAPSQDTSEKNLFDESELVELREAAVTKIKHAATGSLASHPKLALLLSYWKKWGNTGEVETYIDQLTKTPNGCLQLLQSLVLRSLRHGMGDYLAEERFYMRSKDIETLIPMDTLATRVKDISADILDDQGKRALNAVQKAIERRDAGKSDDDPFAID